MDIKLLTENATFDPYSDADYRTMFEEGRGLYVDEAGDQQWLMGYGKFCAIVGMDEGSKAEWNRWYRGERGYGTTKSLSREYRNALRKLMDLPLLPPTVADAIAQHTSPDAKVTLVGDGVADEVILLAPRSDSVTLYINGDVRLGIDVPSHAGGAVPSGTRSRRAMYRPVLAPELKDRVEASGMTASELIEYALEVRAREF